MYTARLTLPYTSDNDVDNLGSALDDSALSFSAEIHGKDPHKEWVVQWVFADKPDAANLNQQLGLNSTWDIEQLPQKDWLAESYRGFEPFTIGQFFIYGSHFEGTVPEGLVGMQIDAATAFGSGEHGTTRGCIEAMIDLKSKGICPWNVLDMGTGSGILAIAAWNLWHTPILAVDNDEEATIVAARHRDLNKITGDKMGLSCDTGDGFKTPSVQARKPYDLVIANILAGPLIEMAAELKAVTDENGYVILSGLLQTQEADILKAYEALGFVKKKHYHIGEWSALVLHNASA